MRVALVGLIVVLISGQIQPFNAEAADSEQQLSGLKAKLMKLREVLEHINRNLEKKEEAQVREKKSFSIGQIDLDKFKQQLSPEDQQRLDHLQSKLKYLKAALQEKVGPNPGDDDKGENKRNDVPDSADSDGKLKQFEEELSSSDQALIQRMRSKLKYLNAALAEEKGNNPGDSEEEIAKTEEKREEDELDEDVLANFSPEIQALLKKHPSQIKFMKIALEHKDANPGDEEEEEPEANEETKREQPENSDLDNFIDDLTPKDAAVLKKLKSKLQYLKQALQEEKNNPKTDEKDKDMKIEISDGKFGGFVDTKQKRVFDEPWHDSPVPDEQLGVDTGEVDERCLSGRCNCREGRCEDDDNNDKEVDERCLTGRCKCREGRCEDGDNDKVDERCLSGRCECRDGRCQEDQSKVLHDTEKRLISDVREAKAKGVNLRSLLRALQSRASPRLLDEESELEKLGKGGA